jgi:hypothetical protein
MFYKILQSCQANQADVRNEEREGKKENFDQLFFSKKRKKRFRLESYTDSEQVYQVPRMGVKIDFQTRSFHLLDLSYISSGD